MIRFTSLFLIALTAGCLDNIEDPTKEVESAVKPPTCPTTRTCPVPQNNGGWAYLFYEVNTCSVTGDIECHWQTAYQWQTTYIDIQAGCEHCRPYGQADEYCGQQYGPSQWTCSAE